MNEKESFQNDYWSKIDNLGFNSSLIKLFNRLMGTYLFAKDERGRFTLANQLHVKRCGEEHNFEVIDKAHYDFFPVSLAEMSKS